MKMKLVGITNVDYISKKTNERVQGKSLHGLVACKATEGVGEKCENVYVSANSDLYKQVEKMVIGSEINVYYNRFGGVEDIAVNK